MYKFINVPMKYLEWKITVKTRFFSAKMLAEVVLRVNLLLRYVFIPNENRLIEKVEGMVFTPYENCFIGRFDKMALKTAAVCIERLSFG